MHGKTRDLSKLKKLKGKGAPVSHRQTKQGLAFGCKNIQNNAQANPENKQIKLNFSKVSDATPRGDREKKKFLSH